MSARNIAMDEWVAQVLPELTKMAVRLAEEDVPQNEVNNRVLTAATAILTVTQAISDSVVSPSE